MPDGTGKESVPMIMNPLLVVITVSSGIGENVNVNPSLVVVTGVVRPVGMLKLSVPIKTTPPLVEGLVSAVAVGFADCGGGGKVNVKPSVVSVTGVVCPVGTVIVAVPTMITPVVEMTERVAVFS